MTEARIDSLNMCDVCGKPAMRMIRDMRETEPTERGGRVWRAWEPEQPIYRCGDHARQPRKRFLDGRVVEEGMSR